MKTIVSRLGTLGFGLALAFIATSSPAEASSITIQNVTVTQAVGADVRTWCMIGCVFNQGAGNLWANFANTVINSPSTGGTQSLVLTQNPTTDVPGFNFDTSEHIFDAGAPVAAASCGQDGGGSPSCVMTLNILTNLLGLVSVPLPLNNALNNSNLDPGGVHQEASNWNLSVLNQPGGLHVWVGYADTAHPGACADTTGTVLSNCLPDNPWQGSLNTIFAGQAITDPVGCLRPDTPSCFDAGAIRIELNDPIATAVPEPASMMLLATGLAGLMARRRSRARNER